MKNIRTKWSNLVRTYRLNLKSSSARKFPYFNELDEILKYETFGSTAGTSPPNDIKTILIDDEDENGDLYDGEMDESVGDAFGEEEEEVTNNHFEALTSPSPPSERSHSRRTSKHDFYRSKILDLMDRRKVRNQKLNLAISKEERKMRQLELKEKQFDLDRRRFELDKRRFLLEEKKAK